MSSARNETHVVGKWKLFSTENIIYTLGIELNNPEVIFNKRNCISEE